MSTKSKKEKTEQKKPVQKQPTAVASESESESESENEVEIEIVKRGKGKAAKSKEKSVENKQIIEQPIAIPQSQPIQIPVQAHQHRYPSQDEIDMADLFTYMSVIDRKVSKIRKGQKMPTRQRKKKVQSDEEVETPAPKGQVEKPEAQDVMAQLKQQMLLRF